jgi:hypothetical protein
MQLFGVALVVLLVGITLLVLVRSREGGRARRTAEGREPDSGRSTSGRDGTAGRR